MTVQPLTVLFKDISKKDLPLVGGKGANLGEMVKAGFPVPDGFAVTVPAYNLFLKENVIENKIRNVLKTTDVHQPDQLNDASKRIQSLIKRSEIPKEVIKAVYEFYKNLSTRRKPALVAVRSSATAEDLPDASFAGQQATYLNIKGDANLLISVRNCWASLFTARAIFYREENKIAHHEVGISVIVQKMIQAEVSGVLFTVDPVTNKKDRIIIEAVWGLGELIVQGAVLPDHYVVQKETFSILSKKISSQKKQLVKVKDTTKEVEVPVKQMDLQKLSDEDIISLAKIADKIQKHYYFPQDIEWARDKKNLYIVQTRPITTLDKKVISKKNEDGKETSLTTAAPILSGTGASPGIGSGQVKIIKTAKDINKIKTGDILVSIMTSPDFVPAMKKAAAIVTDKGGQTSHAAIVSREMGIPCIVGTKTATSTLNNNQVVTVDGSNGMVYSGGEIKTDLKKTVTKKKKRKSRLKTATKIYVNLAEPERANEVAKANVEGVGLLRAEFMIANIGIHPQEAIKLKKQERYVTKLAADISTFCRAFYPRPVVYRATDFKTNEYRSLSGGKAWEPEEPNPMLGYRGAFRYLANPEVFTLELRALKRVMDKYKNLYLMIPFVRSPEELGKVRRMVKTEGFFDIPTFKFWMMVEIPTNVIILGDYIKEGIDGVSIGSNDLTMLVSGTDRDNEEVASAFDERSPAVLWAIKRTIKIALKHGITSSICGQAPSVYDGFAEKLVNYGITSISVNPDAIDRVREIVAEAEKKKGRK